MGLYIDTRIFKKQSHPRLTPGYRFCKHPVYLNFFFQTIIRCHHQTVNTTLLLQFNVTIALCDWFKNFRIAIYRERFFRSTLTYTAFPKVSVWKHDLPTQGWLIVVCQDFNLGQLIFIFNAFRPSSIIRKLHRNFLI